MSLDAFTIVITVTSDEKGTLAYMKNNDGNWIPLMQDPSGKYVIHDAEYGINFIIRATPDNDGHAVVWKDERGTRMTTQTYSFTTDSDRSLEVAFLPADESNGWMWIIIGLILAAAVIAALWFFLVWRRYIIHYMVMFSDRGLESVRIDHTVNGELREPLFTDTSGNYRIKVPKDSEVMITGVTRDGYTVSEILPRRIIAEKRVVEAVFTMIKK
jgi:hypothetical protein